MIKFFIAGYYGLGNIGDEAILSGIIQSLKGNFKDIKITTLTNDKKFTEEYHNISAVEHSFKKGKNIFLRNQLSKGESLKICKEINKCDIFILGGGELIQDIKFYYLPSLFSLIKYAQLKRKKTVIYGIGAGPIETNFGKKLTKKVLKQVDLITVRDEKSKIALEKCGLDNVIQTADPAFSIKVPSKEELNYNKQFFLEDEYFSATAHNRLYYDDTFRATDGALVDLDKRRTTFSKVYNDIASTFNKKVFFLPTVESDVNGFLHLKENMDENNCKIMDYSESIIPFLASLQSSELLIGMKLHSLIFATLLGKPFVPIAYSSKVESYIDILGLKELSMNIEEINEPNFNSNILNNIRNVMNDKNFSKFLVKKSAILKKKSLENATLIKNIL